MLFRSDAINAKFIRDIEPGEVVIIDENGVESIKYDVRDKKSYSSFEYVYFARPDSVIDGINVYSSRHEAGKLLYEQNPIEADLVIGVPDSGVPAAIGYSEASGIPYGAALLKNKYVGTTAKARCPALAAALPCLGARMGAVGAKQRDRKSVGRERV